MLAMDSFILCLPCLRDFEFFHVGDCLYLFFDGLLLVLDDFDAFELLFLEAKLLSLEGLLFASEIFLFLDPSPLYATLKLLEFPNWL